MENLDWVLELVLVGLLALTLVHAVRLERALRGLRQDRAALGEAIAGFDDSARQAEAGIGRLHMASAETAQCLAERLAQAGSLKDDLSFLIERGEAIADRLDGLVRTTRSLASAAPSPALATAAVAPPAVASVPPAPAAGTKVRSKAERDLLLALQNAN